MLALSVAATGAILLSLYAGDEFDAPAGFDTPKYIWRANLVGGEGLQALPGSSPFREHPDRPGYPVFAALVRSTTGISPLDLTFVLPAIVGTMVGLGAGAFALSALREPRWVFPIYAIVVGASLNVVLTASGLLDNLLLDALIMAAAVTALLAAEGRRTTAATLGLVAGATLIHWPLTAVFLAVLGLVALVLLVGQVSTGGLHRGLLRTPPGRLGTLVAASGVVMAGALAILGATIQAPISDVGRFTRKLGRFTARYRFPVTGIAAALGVAALWVPRDDQRRRGLVLLLLWGAVAAVAVPMLVVVGAPVPAHRLLGFALGIPVLGAAAVMGAGRLATRVRPRAAGAAIAVIVSVAAVVGTAGLARAAWEDRARVKFPGEGLAQARTAGAYLDSVENEDPVVFVVNPGAADPRQPAALAFSVIRSGLPSDQIRLAHVFLGEPEDLLAGRPTLRPGEPGFNSVSRTYWDAVRPHLAQEPPVILLSGFNARLPDPIPGNAVAPGITIVRGPPPPTPVGTSAAPVPPEILALVARFGAVLLLVIAVGAGWAVSLLPGGGLLRASLAPALGLAALVVGGTVAGRLGVDGPTARQLAVAAILAAGWVLPAVRRWRDGSGTASRRGDDTGGAA